jgi:hypothetical protein
MNKLNREEKDILKSFEQGEWQSVSDRTRLAQLRSYAKATLAKRVFVNDCYNSRNGCTKGFQ